MGAETRVYVKVAKASESWIECSAVTLDEAKEQAVELPGVTEVLSAQYDVPDGFWE